MLLFCQVLTKFVIHSQLVDLQPDNKLLQQTCNKLCSQQACNKLVNKL